MYSLMPEHQRTVRFQRYTLLLVRSLTGICWISPVLVMICCMTCMVCPVPLCACWVCPCGWACTICTCWPSPTCIVTGVVCVQNSG